MMQQPSPQRAGGTTSWVEDDVGQGGRRPLTSEDESEYDDDEDAYDVGEDGDAGSDVSTISLEWQEWGLWLDALTARERRILTRRLHRVARELSPEEQLHEALAVARHRRRSRAERLAKANVLTGGSAIPAPATTSPAQAQPQAQSQAVGAGRSGEEGGNVNVEGSASGLNCDHPVLDLERRLVEHSLQQQSTSEAFGGAGLDNARFSEHFQPPPQSELGKEMGVLMEGQLSKFSPGSRPGGKWHDRYFVLYDNLELQYFAKSRECGWGTIPIEQRGVIPLSMTRVELSSSNKKEVGREFVLHCTWRGVPSRYVGQTVTSNKHPQETDQVRSVRLRAPNAEARLTWVAILDRAISCARIVEQERQAALRR